MTGHTGRLQFAEPLSPWRRAQKPAGTAFGIGFLLATLAGAEGIPHQVALSPEVLSALIASLTCGLLCASAVYVLAVIVCSLRAGHSDSAHGTVSRGPARCRERFRGEDFVAVLFFLTLVLIVCLHEVLQHRH